MLLPLEAGVALLLRSCDALLLILAPAPAYKIPGGLIHGDARRPFALMPFGR